MPEIIDVRSRLMELPLKDPFETAKGSKTSSPAVIIEIRLSDGTCGLGSVTPVQYVTEEDTESVINAVGAISDFLVGCDTSRYGPLFQTLAEELPTQHSARAGLEMAVFDAFCKQTDIPMCNFFGGNTPYVETDLTIPIVPPETARELARKAHAAGFKYLKIKVGSKNPDEDIERVIAVSEGAPKSGIRLDANQGFEPEFAISFVSSLRKSGVKVDMLEQPVDRHDIDGLRYVTEYTSVPVFADESCVTPADAVTLIRLGAVDGINVKLMKCGFSGALEIISLCRAAKKELMLGCMIESGIGLSAAVHLACGTGAFGRLDLDAHILLSPDDRFSQGFIADGPTLSVDDTIPGHGGVVEN